MRRLYHSTAVRTPRRPGVDITCARVRSRSPAVSARCERTGAARPLPHSHGSLQFVDALAGVVDDDRRNPKRLRADPDDALARADDDEAADGLTRAHDLEAVAEGEKRGAYGYN